LVENVRQPVPEEFVRPPQPAKLGEGCVLEVLGVDGQAAGDVVLTDRRAMTVKFS
jgi:hypothetical protein